MSVDDLLLALEQAVQCGDEALIYEIEQILSARC